MTQRRHSTRDLVLGGLATLVAVTTTFAVMGLPTTFLCLGLIAAFVVWAVRGPVAPTPRRGLVAAYSLGLLLFLFHVGEEWLSGFPRQFPPLFGAEWTTTRWELFNGIWLAVFTLAGYGIRRGVALAYLGVWAFALVAGIANGMGHVAICLYVGHLFPGIFTAPLCLAVGIVLVQKLTDDQRTRAIVLFFENLVFTVLVPGSVTIWIPSGLGLFPATVTSLPWTVSRLVALVPLGIGVGIYVRCVWEFASRGRGIPAPIDHPKALVVTGLYRYVRNPMYVGVLCVLTGEATFLQSRDLLFYTLGFFAFIHINVLVCEEPNLRRRFGESYVRYTESVNRWIPGRPYGVLMAGSTPLNHREATRL